MYRQSEKKLVQQQYLLHMSCPHNMVNFGPLAAEIVSLVCGSPANFNGFCILAALLHGTPVLSISQTAAFNRGATYIWQGGHHVGHWPTFLVLTNFLHDINPLKFTHFTVCALEKIDIMLIL